MGSGGRRWVGWGGGGAFDPHIRKGGPGELAAAGSLNSFQALPPLSDGGGPSDSGPPPCQIRGHPRDFLWVAAGRHWPGMPAGA